jgi:hypothetical protein
VEAVLESEVEVFKEDSTLDSNSKSARQERLALNPPKPRKKVPVAVLVVAAAVEVQNPARKRSAARRKAAGVAVDVAVDADVDEFVSYFCLSQKQIENKGNSRNSESRICWEISNVLRSWLQIFFHSYSHLQLQT